VNELEHKEKNKAENIIDKIKSSFSGRKFRSGAYVSVVSAIIIAITLVINLIVSELELQVDLSSESFFTLTKETENIVKNLTEDVTIYYIVEPGNETPIFERIIDEYDNLSDKLRLEYKDPVLYPNFVSNYLEDINVSQNSFLIVNEVTQRAKYIAGTDMLVQEINYSTYSMETTGIDVEGKITSAIQFVSNPDLPVMYVVTGHGEVKTGEIFADMMDKQNVIVNELATLTAEEIPEDCDILLINSPETDLSEDEATMIKEYLKNGGNAIITLDYRAQKMENLSSVLDYYGIGLVEGFILEGDTGKYLPNNPYFILPDVEKHDITTKVLDNTLFTILPVASGLEIKDNTRSSLGIEPLLSTSDKAYSKVNINASTIEKEENDIDGPFFVGLLATDQFDNITSNLMVFSARAIFDEGVLLGYGNGDLLSGAIGYLSGDMEAISIPTRSLASNYITLTQKQAISWGAVAIIVIPAIILGIGVFVCLRRRKR